MFARQDKNSEIIVKMAVNLALKNDFQLARQVMTEAGISFRIIERILYEPENIRKTDLT